MCKFCYMIFLIGGKKKKGRVHSRQWEAHFWEVSEKQGNCHEGTVPKSSLGHHGPPSAPASQSHSERRHVAEPVLRCHGEPRGALKEDMLALVAVFRGKWKIHVQHPLGKWRAALWGLE